MVKNEEMVQKIPQKAINLTIRKVNKSLKIKRIVRNTMRRSVTIEPALHDFIIELRGWFALEKRIDSDYTTVLNMLAKMGALRVLDWDNLTDREKEVMRNTLESDPTQRRESAADEVWTRHLKNELPDYDPEPIEEESQKSAKGKEGVKNN